MNRWHGEISPSIGAFRRVYTEGQTTAERSHQRKGEFRKVGENLYRYSSNDRYYGVFRVNGKLIWKNLKPGQSAARFIIAAIPSKCGRICRYRVGRGERGHLVPHVSQRFWTACEQPIETTWSMAGP